MKVVKNKILWHNGHKVSKIPGLGLQVVTCNISHMKIQDTNATSDTSDTNDTNDTNRKIGV